MGGGEWTTAAYANLSATKSYDKARSVTDVLTQRTVHAAMEPIGVDIRESRDSDEHPTSLAIMIWLDVTGSMGRIPLNFVKEGMPDLMMGIMDKGVEHPQIFFGAIGDHECDRFPLQVGQFESSTQLIDKWLTSTYFEKGGGGNSGESYLLAWYFAGKHTSIDCWEKRKEKGFLFTIGDEPCLPNVPGEFLKRQMASGQFKDSYTAEELLKEAQERYHVFHIHANDGSYRDTQKLTGGWRTLLGDNFVVVENHKDIASTIAKIVGEVSKSKGKNDMPLIDRKEESIL